MIVLVCGGRDYANSTQVKEVLDRLPISLLIHGAARGADTLASFWALRKGIPVKSYSANWDRDGKKAGPLRNIQMLRESKPELIVAFPGGSGTAHMVEIAKAAGVRVMEVPA